MNEINKKRKAEEKRLEQAKTLLQMKKEIEALESKIKQSKLVNAKIGAIKNLKIGARALQAVAPYVLTAGIVTGSFSLFGHTPLHIDERNTYSHVMTKFDSTGNIRYEEQRITFREYNIDNMLYYYPKWQKDDYNSYSRTVQTYSIKNKTYEDVIKLFEQENLKLEDILGEPISNIKETAHNLSAEELEEEPFIATVIYNKEHIIHTETVAEESAYFVLYFIAIAIAEGFTVDARCEYSSFDFSECVDEIKRNHQPLDIETLRKKLELKRDKYNSITK